MQVNMDKFLKKVSKAFDIKYEQLLDTWKEQNNVITVKHLFKLISSKFSIKEEDLKEIWVKFSYKITVPYIHVIDIPIVKPKSKRILPMPKGAKEETGDILSDKTLGLKSLSIDSEEDNN